eukprot:3017145-Pyramimonas_sp.AAC.1
MQNNQAFVCCIQRFEVGLLLELGLFVCCIQRSELGLLLGLGPQNYSYSSSHLDRCCPFSVLNSGCSKLQSWCAQKLMHKHRGRPSVASRDLNSVCYTS